MALASIENVISSFTLLYGQISEENGSDRNLE